MKNILLIFLFLFCTIKTNSYSSTSLIDNKYTETNNQRLFIIERNMNKNIVCYDAKVTKTGKLNIDDPIDAYWIDYATDGKRSELNYIQRKMAYGFEFEKINNDKIYLILKAFDKRKILVYIDSRGTSRALIKINGIDAILNKIFVDAKPKLYTSVNFIELFGTDIKTGKTIYEKISDL